METEMQNSQCF